MMIYSAHGGYERRRTRVGATAQRKGLGRRRDSPADRADHWPQRRDQRLSTPAARRGPRRCTPSVLMSIPSQARLFARPVRGFPSPLQARRTPIWIGNCRNRDRPKIVLLRFFTRAFATTPEAGVTPGLCSASRRQGKRAPGRKTKGGHRFRYVTGTGCASWSAKKARPTLRHW